MTFVVGLAPGGRARASLHLAAMLARSSGDELVLCSVVPLPWAPGPARVDAEYRAYLDEAARQVLDEARERLPDDVTATYAVRHARSAPAGLMDAAQEHDAGLIVVGSSSAGVFGHVSLGSVTDGLLHSSPTPVALAPRGFRCSPGARCRARHRRVRGVGRRRRPDRRRRRRGRARRRLPARRLVRRCGRGRQSRPASGGRPTPP